MKNFLNYGLSPGKLCNQWPCLWTNLKTAGVKVNVAMVIWHYVPGVSVETTTIVRSSKEIYHLSPKSSLSSSFTECTEKLLRTTTIKISLPFRTYIEPKLPNNSCYIYTHLNSVFNLVWDLWIYNCMLSAGWLTCIQSVTCLRWDLCLSAGLI